MEIFLSYSRQNLHLIRSLVEDIEALGHQVWYDHELSGGQSWWDEILKQIQNCDVFVFALSWHSLNSQPCRLEYSYAHQLNKNILPVLMTDDVPVNRLPQALSVIQFVDYRHPDKQAALSLGRSFANLPPSRPLPDPLPEQPEVPISYLVRLQDRIEGDAPLTEQEQALILRELKEHFGNDDERDEIRRLLQQMRWRTDLDSRVEREIDTLLGGIAQTEAQSFTDVRPLSLAEFIVPVTFWIGVLTIPFWLLLTITRPATLADGQTSPLWANAVVNVVCFPVMCAIFPGLPLAVFMGLYYRGTRIKLAFRDKIRFVEMLQTSLPLRYKLASRTANEIVFKGWSGWSRLPGMRTADHIYVQFDQYSATITGPASILNRIQKRMGD